MGLLINRVERSEIKPGDHIYTYKAIFTYSHHGIFVGGSKVVHFRPKRNLDSSTKPSSNLYDPISPRSTCPTFPDCGFRQPDSGVLSTGQCTFFKMDLEIMTYSRITVKTLHCIAKLVGRSGQASFVIGAPLAALLSSPLKLLMPSPVGMETVTARMYCMIRYATNINVRSDVIKVAVKELVVSLGWVEHHDETTQENEALSRQLVTLDGLRCKEQLARKQEGSE
ncbi:hypothetical protein CXB51_016914 [Gossypium anomalum]|uniref:LRAT domain-containing protein n=1 Tax=Gossypium anomalum TaxID=47600 RepID=A0A8J5Z4X0_9ROSI|nr:hypothetical protein CXB51_016914 [Gossypium anomalum]